MSKSMRYCNLVLLGLVFIISSCSEDFLGESPTGELTEDQIKQLQNIEGLVISTYSALNGQIDDASNAYNSPASNWSFGDVVSDDAYKGGGGTGDQNNIHQMEIFNTNPTILDIERKWLALYEGIRRANEAIHQLNESKEVSEDLRRQRIAEMRFLRGHFFFELKKIYNRISWIEAGAVDVNAYDVSNQEYTMEELWGLIEKEFMAAAEVLPENQEEPGRPTYWAARAYLAKTYLFQEKWSAASEIATEIINSGKYQLMDNFGEVFKSENDNGSEIIFAVQHSINDGSPNNYNSSIGDRLAAPGGPFYAQYGFHRPSQDLVNTFATNEQGLPVNPESDLARSDPADPRIDYTIARPNVPYLDLGINYEASWARDLATYGPFSPKKRIVSANSDHYLSVWPYTNDLNYYIIRYADVLLWKAEAAIQMGDLETGQEYINMIRERAENTPHIQNLEGSSDAASYVINTYTQPFDSQQEAIAALRRERRLEFAMEGKRFFDLVRWGIADSVINSFLQKARSKRTYLQGASFESGTHEYFPIPQSQIDLGQNKMEQNPGYN